MIWPLPGCRVELCLWQVSPELPAGMRIDQGWLGHWRIRPERAADPPALRCRLGGGDDLREGGGDSGEGLDAQTWDTSRHRLTIGTEDADALAWRTGVASALVLPRGAPGQVLDRHHAVAWRKTGKHDDASTWFAVEAMRAALPPELRG